MIKRTIIVSLVLLMIAFVTWLTLYFCASRINKYYVSDFSADYECMAICGVHATGSGVLVKREGKILIKNSQGAMFIKEEFNLSNCLNQKVIFSGFVKKRLWSDVLYMQKVETIIVSSPEINHESAKCFYDNQTYWD